MNNINIEEYNAVRNHVGIIDLSDRGRFKIKGNDQLKFLQSMITNNVLALKPQEGMYATILNAKGKILSDMHIYRLDDHLIIDLETGYDTVVQDILLKHKFMADISIENMTQNYNLYSLHGISSKELLQKTFNIQLPLFKEYSCTPIKYNDVEILIISRNRTGEKGYDLITSSSYGKDIWNLLLQNGKEYSIGLFSKDTLDILRLEAGIPVYGIDMDDSVIFNEAQLDHGVSYQKGCYVGQETVARIKWRGNPNWLLSSMTIDTENPPQKDCKILLDNSEVGYITSSAYSPELKKTIALGYLKKDFSEPETELTINLSDQNYQVNVVGKPFFRRPDSL